MRRSNGILWPLRDRATYRSLAFLLSAAVLGPVWFALIGTGWVLAVVLAITPLVVFVLVGLAAVTRALAVVEAGLAKELLGVDVGRREPLPSTSGFWARGVAVLRSRARWREQAYLMLRFFLGGPLAIVVASLLGSALWLIAAPIHYRWVDIDWGIWRIDTFAESLLLVPVGLIGLVLTLLLVRPLAALWRSLARRLLVGAEGRAPSPARLHAIRRRGLSTHAWVVAAIGSLLIVIWAATTRGSFWPY
jgi:hypothetical protein